MALNKPYTWVAVVGIVALAAAAWWWQGRSVGVGVVGVVVGSTAPGASPANIARQDGAEQGGAGRSAVNTVEVGKVESITLQDDAQAVGSLRARQGVVLRPEVSGRIAQLPFKDGQRVRAGQLLMQLDDSLQQAQLRQAQAQAGIARTNLQRNRELVAQNFISQSAVDQSAAGLEVAEAQVALAQAQLQRMKVLAPFDGVAGIRSVNVGDYVKDGADLVNIEDLSYMWVDFSLPERFVARVKPGQLVEVTLDAVAGRQFTGRVEALEALVEADGRSLRVRARLDNPGQVLRSGLFARTRIVFARREGALVVPEEALVPQGGKQYLIKVVDGPNGLVSQRIEAKLGQRLPGKAEIVEGLKAGDRVVTAGQARLMRGDALPLRIVEISGTAAPRGPADAASGAGGSSAPRGGPPA
ncbi:MAG: efflux RND transporter periplasmic adaptor subunit [Rubrivivax sp.]